MPTKTEVCAYCILEMCFQCGSPDMDAEECCCLGTYGRTSLGSLFGSPTVLPKEVDPLTKGKVGHPPVPDELLKNPLTAGRARAEDLAPIPEGYICEWAMLLNAGGGPFPIIGCSGNYACDRHHGPDKNTLNNSVGINLHRICDTCHNRWHAANDEYYGERPKSGGVAYLPFEGIDWTEHDRVTRADPEDVKRSNEYWGLGKGDRGGLRNFITLTRSGKVLG